MNAAAKLKIGDKVIFNRIKVGSYLAEKVLFVVEDIDESCYFFRDPITKGGTFEKISNIENPSMFEYRVFNIGNVDINLLVSFAKQKSWPLVQ